jgi:hypothetical protein
MIDRLKNIPLGTARGTVPISNMPLQNQIGLYLSVEIYRAHPKEMIILREISAVALGGVSPQKVDRSIIAISRDGECFSSRLNALNCICNTTIETMCGRVPMAVHERPRLHRSMAYRVYIPHTAPFRIAALKESVLVSVAESPRVVRCLSLCGRGHLGLDPRRRQSTLL